MIIIIRTRIRLFDSRSKLSCSGHCLLPPTSPIRWIYARITAINTTTTLIHGDAGRWVLFRFIKPKLCKYQFFAKAKWEVQGASSRERSKVSFSPSLSFSPSQTKATVYYPVFPRKYKAHTRPLDKTYTTATSHHHLNLINENAIC